MKKLLSMLAALLLVFSALIVPQPQAAAAAPEAAPVMTYMRFNRYGGDIYATYCIASAMSHDIYWGATAPVQWNTWAGYGAINNCVTKYLFSQVASGEQLYVDVFAYADWGERYYFTITANGSTNIYCEIDNNTSSDDMQPGVTTATSCAFVQ
ncbi:hypothetical protein [Herpetosiphon geysericola]|uniref:Uncharacterized protein n=1 Tax=Herpetosiphon geysericola TaxID=70996 RepID=A0A0P6Z082_9CHLR|nr:hypothetical protein [Herpetosiphon geysericola]KPL90206.1 hypothetical protein SE18_08375 [Herpetosiphon geysericola]